MRSSTIISVVLASSACAPAFAAPLPQGSFEFNNRDIDARALPIAALLKELGKGVLSGGALAGLAALLGEGSSSTSQRRDLEARVSDELAALAAAYGSGNISAGAFAGIAALLDAAQNSTASSSSTDLQSRSVGSSIGGILEKLVGAGGLSLSQVIKAALIGGAASATGAAATNEVTSNVKRAGIPGAAAEVIDSAGTTAIKGLVNGIGSALAGTAVGVAIEKLFNRDLSDDDVEELLHIISSSKAPVTSRALSDLTDDEVNMVLEFIGTGKVQKRAIGSLGKGLIGLAASLGASSITGEVIDEIKKLVRREASLNDLD